MSVKGIHWAQNMRGVCPFRKALLFALGERHHKDQNIVIADQVMLADEAGMSDRTVRKYLKLLEQDGLVSPRVVGLPGGGRISHYTLAFGRTRPLSAGAVRKDAPDLEKENLARPVRKISPDQKAVRTGKQVPDQSGSLVPFPKDTKKHEEKNMPKPKPVSASGPSPAFQKLWSMWPSKGRKRCEGTIPDVERVFAKACERRPAEEIIRAAAAYLRENPDPQFVQGLDRWLKKQRYEHFLADEPAAASSEPDWPTILAAWLETGAWKPALGPTPDKPGYRGPLEPLRPLVAGRNPDHPVIAAIAAKLEPERLLV